MKKCPQCAEDIRAEALKCRYCGSNVGGDNEPTPQNTKSQAVVSSPTREYNSSRWSRGNLFFPDSLVLSNDGIVFHKGRIIGSSEEHINFRAVASVRVGRGLFFVSIKIETSGGSQPIFINGLSKIAAREIQDFIRSHQQANR